MSKERLQETKENWLEVNEGAFMSPLLKKALIDIPWLISEVERLQAHEEYSKRTAKMRYELICKEQDKVERLEKALQEIAGISDTNPYRESELMRLAAKQALETEGKE